jgi:hypothetical protein
MLCARQARLIEDHWETIAHRALGRIRNEIPRSSTLPDQLILDRVKDLLSHLSDWLNRPDEVRLGERYERIGRMRVEEGGHLHELLRALQMIRLSAVDFMLEHDVGEGPLTAHAERDLEYRFSKFFDVVIYHFVRGFELEWQKVAADPSAASRARRLKDLLHASGHSS